MLPPPLRKSKNLEWRREVDKTKIVGANGNRRERDYYPTPPECTEALITFLENANLIEIGQRVWEPACGEGHIVNVLVGRGYNTLATDIKDGNDFLRPTQDEPDFDWIITNPPFCLASEFIQKAYEYGKPFAFLLKSQFWHSKKRLALFKECQPDLILPLTWRPDFTGQGASLMDMIWCVWGCGKFHRPDIAPYYIPLQKPIKEA